MASNSNNSSISCCVCSSESDDMYALDEIDMQVQHYSIAQVQEASGDSLYLCGACVSSHNEFSDFRNVFIKSEKNLRRLVEPNQESEMEEEDDETNNNVNQESEMEEEDDETNNNLNSVQPSETEADTSVAYVEVGISTYNIDSEQSGAPDLIRTRLAAEELQVFPIEVDDNCCHGIFKYECTVCGRNYFDKDAFQQHMADQHSLNINCADYIWVVLLSFDNVRHTLEELSQKVNTNIEDIQSNQSGVPETSPTQKVNTNNEDIQSNQSGVSETSPTVPVCSEHLQVIEVEGVDNFRCGIIKFACPVCESIYLNKVAFQQHMARHIGYNINDCDEYASLILLTFD